MIWKKYHCVVINDVLQSVTLHEFIINESGDEVKSLKSDFIYQEEYPEYIQDSDNWYPISRFFQTMGSLNHWSAIKTIRLTQKVKNELMILDEEEIAWIYRSIEE